MSDRYKQLEIVENLERLSIPPVVSKSRSKGDFEMYPNFSVGDRILIGNKYWNPWFYGKEATVTGFTDHDTLKIVLDDGFKWQISPEWVTKVRVHLPVEHDCKTGTLTHDDTKQDHKSPSIHYEIKEIKGRKYKYARWWEGDRHKSKYIGKA